MSSDSVMATATEIEITVPWGHIAGKSWSWNNAKKKTDEKDANLEENGCMDAVRTDNRRLLMVHGMQDNCGSFDRLVTALSTTSIVQESASCEIVAVDLPGHGYSSHLPAGLPLMFSDFLSALRRVVDHLQWNTFVYIGHSFGGQLGSFFTGMYQSMVEKLVILDTMAPVPLKTSTPAYMKAMIENQLLLEKKHRASEGRKPVYSRKEALRKMVNQRPSKLSDEAAEVLFQRAVRPVDNTGTDEVSFCCDQRMKWPPAPGLCVSQHIEFLANITCPTLYILASENMTRYSTNLKEIYEYNRSKDNCRIVVVEGNHDTHQNTPQLIAPIINDFLLTDMPPRIAENNLDFVHPSNFIAET